MTHKFCGTTIIPPKGSRLAFLIVLSLEVWAVVAATIVSMTRFQYPLTAAEEPNFAFALAVIINALFVQYFVVHGILRERRGEIIIVCLASCLILAYALYGYFEQSSNVSKDEKIVRLAVACVAAPVNVIWCIFILQNMDWLTFELVGADYEMQTLYTRYCHFTCLLDADLQLSICWVIIAFFSGILSVPQQILAGIGLTVIILLRFATHFWITFELKWMTIPFFILSLTQPAYVIYKFIEIAQDWDKLSAIVAYPAVVLGSICFILHIAVIVLAIFVFKGFDKGLPSHLHRKQEEQTLLGASVSG